MPTSLRVSARARARARARVSVTCVFKLDAHFDRFRRAAVHHDEMCHSAEFLDHTQSVPPEVRRVRRRCRLRLGLGLGFG